MRKQIFYNKISLKSVTFKQKLFNLARPQETKIVQFGMSLKEEIMEKQILHVDVNNAFLSWTAVEMLKQGSELDIRQIPAIIGGDESKRSGIVLAKSMKAKECGVNSRHNISSTNKMSELKSIPIKLSNIS